MKYKDFDKAIALIVKHNEKSHAAHELKIDLYDYSEHQEHLIYLLWSNILTEPGLDWFNWFMYEKGGHTGKLSKDMKAYDGKTEICKTQRGLYNYLIKNKYFKYDGRE